jgi:hypothetical protein
MAVFWIRVGDLGESILQNVQNDVHEERPIKRFSWGQHDDIDNSDEGEIYAKHDLPCTEKMLGLSWRSYASTYPHCGPRIFKVDN